MFKSAVVGSAAAQLLGKTLSEGDQEFIQFVTKYGKSYASRAEFEARSKIFQEKLAAVTEHNSQNDITHTIAINAFADLSEAEWAKMRGYMPTARNGITSDFADVQADDSKDWYADGMVNDPKDQGACGSCWAFSAVGSIESANAIAGKGLKSFAEQQLVDCDRTTGGN